MGQDLQEIVDEYGLLSLVTRSIPTPSSEEALKSQVYVNTTGKRVRPKIGFGINVVAWYFLNPKVGVEEDSLNYFSPVSDVYYSFMHYFPNETKFVAVHNVLIEMVKHSFRYGNKFNSEQKVVFSIYDCKGLMLMAFNDNGEGIPDEIVDKIRAHEIPDIGGSYSRECFKTLVDAFNAEQVDAIYGSEDTHDLILAVGQDAARGGDVPP